MIKTVQKLLLLSFVSLFLFGCGIEDIVENDREQANHVDDTITPISDLDHTEYFRNGALEHILEGELNKQGQAVGFHYDRLPTKKGEVIDGTETEPNEFGVYEAEVIVSDIEKKSNGGKSTFFPDEWDTQEVVDAMNEAYEAKTYISGNTYEGLTSEGMVIRMYLDQQEKIISAFPVY